MEEKSHAIIAVTFLIVFALGVVTIIMWLQRGPREDRYYDIVSSYAVGGLQPEAPVEFKGLRVGNVKKIYFDPHDPLKVIVRIAVFEDAYITHATYAQLGNKGITGLTYIILDNQSGLSLSPLVTNPNHPAVIPMHQGFLQSLEHTSKIALRRINRIAGHVDHLLNKNNREHISAILSQVDQASRQLVRLEQQLEPTIKDMPKIAAQTSKLLKNTRQLESKLKRLADNAEQPVKGIGKTAESITRLSQSSHELVNKLNNHLLPRVEGLVRNMNQTILQIKRLTRQLNAQPQSLIFGQSPKLPGPGEPGFQPPPSK